MDTNISVDSSHEMDITITLNMRHQNYKRFLMMLEKLSSIPNGVISAISFAQNNNAVAVKDEEFEDFLAGQEKR